MLLISFFFFGSNKLCDLLADFCFENEKREKKKINVAFNFVKGN